MTETPAKVIKVDGINNVLIDVSIEAFEAVNLDPRDHPKIVSSMGAPPGMFRLKIGAAGARYVGDLVQIGKNPNLWPAVLPPEAARNHRESSTACLASYRDSARGRKAGTWRRLFRRHGSWTW